MTKDDILKLAREAGCVDPMVFFGAYERFAALVAAAEREAILQMSADNWYKTQAEYDVAIRARGQA